MNTRNTPPRTSVHSAVRIIHGADSPCTGAAGSDRLPASRSALTPRPVSKHLLDKSLRTSRAPARRQSAAACDMRRSRSRNGGRVLHRVLLDRDTGYSDSLTHGIESSGSR